MRKIEVLYWRSARNPYWYNFKVPEMEKLIERYDIEAIRKLKGFDFKFLNINRSDERNWDIRIHGPLIERYRPKKLRKFPLIIVDDGAEKIYLTSEADLKRFESMLSQVRDYYLQ